MNAYLGTPRRRRPLARVRRARAAEPGLHPRAVDAGRLDRVAEGDGVGPPVEPRRRDRPRAPRERAPAEEVARLHPAVPRGTRCPRSSSGDARGRSRRHERRADRRNRRRRRGSRMPRHPTRGRRGRRRRRWRPCSARIDGIPELLGPKGGDLGSNSWVVSARSPSRACRCSRTTRTSARRCRRSGRRWGCTAPSCATTAGSTSAATRSRGCPGVIIGHNERIAWGFTNLGPDVADLYFERVDGDTYELDGADRPAHAPRGDHRGGRRRSGHHHGALHGRGPLVTDIGADFAAVAEGYPAASGQPEGDYGVSLQWTALTPGTTAAGDLRAEPRPGLERLPRGRLALRRAGAEPHLRRRRRQHRLPGAGHRPGARHRRRHRAAPRLDERRTAGRAPCRSTSCPSMLNPERGLHRHGQQPRERTAARCSPRTGTSATGPRPSSSCSTSASPRARSSRPTTSTEIQLDTADANAAAFLPVIAELDLDGDAARGAALLDGWDGRADVDSAEAAYFAVFWRNLLDDMFGVASRADPPRGRRPVVRRRRLAPRRARCPRGGRTRTRGSPAATP